MRRGFHRFGFVGGGIVGDVGFDDNRTAKDWPTTVWGNPDPARAGAGMDVGEIYTPLPAFVLERARANWQRLTDLVELHAPSAARAAARLEQLRRELAANIAVADAYSRSGQYATPSTAASAMPPGTQIRANAFRLINNALAAFAAEAWPDAVEESAAHADAQAQQEAASQAKAEADTAQQAAAAAAAQAQQQQTADAIAVAQRLVAVAEQKRQDALQKQQSAASARAALGKASPWLVGGLAVLVLGGALFALRGRRGRVGGYRRKRRGR